MRPPVITFGADMAQPSHEIHELALPHRNELGGLAELGPNFRIVAKPVRRSPLLLPADRRHEIVRLSVVAPGAARQRRRHLDAIAAHACFRLTGAPSLALASPRMQAPAPAGLDECSRVEAPVADQHTEV
jgi:hypothetical protein